MKMVVLSDICDIHTGKKDANYGTPDGEYLFFTCATEPIRSPTYSFSGESLILPGNGANVGLVLYYNGNFEAYQRTYVLNNFRCNPRYVYHHLNTYWTRRNQFNQYGSATNYIRLKNFLSYTIPLPPLEEQLRIAAILDKADALRRQRQHALRRLDDLLQATFLDMFGDLFTEENKFSLSAFADINPSKKEIYGRFPNSTMITFLPMPRVSEDGEVDCSESKTLEEVSTGYTYFTEGDVLFAKITPCMENGKGGIAENLINGIGFGSTEFHVLRPNKKVSAEWLYTLLSLPFIRRIAESQMTGSAGQKRVPAKFFDRFMMGIPDKVNVTTFSNVYRAIQKLKQQYKSQHKILDNQFFSLQQRAFRGEL